MSERMNQEPPVLGRRTNKGSRRVVRVSGSQDSQVTQISHTVSSQETSAQSQVNAKPESADTTQQVQAITQADGQSVQNAENMPNERAGVQTEKQSDKQSSDGSEPADSEKNRTSAQQTSAAYTRSDKAQRIASELFVDRGIIVPDEVVVEESATQKSAQESSRAVSEHKPSGSTETDSEESAVTSQVVAEEKTQERDENPRVQRSRLRRRITMEDRATSATSANSANRSNNSANRAKAEEQFSAAQEPDSAQDTPTARSERARAAVSQALEFSSSQTNHEDARAVEGFSAPTNPMMSLLFQAPVIPEITRSSRSDYRDEEQNENTLHRNRRHRRDKNHENADNNDVLDTISAALDETERSRSSAQNNQHEDDDNVRSSRRRNRKDKNERNERNERNEENGSAEYVDEFDTDSRSRRNRRLNAQERRAAAEVELIESDLELDEIDYEPIEGDMRNDDEAESFESSSRRPRRRSAMLQEAEEADEEFTTRRRRRRRRGSKNAQDDDNQSSDSLSSSADTGEDTRGRSRKQQYIDEITDVAGSTRLEAKRQRRRDNRRDRNRQAALITEQDFLARREVVNRLMVVRERGSHTQVSVIEDDVLVEHYISDIAEVSAVGNIYQGRVQNVLPSMEAAFVDIGQARNGVLYAGEVNWDTTRLDGQPRRMEHAFQSGDPVLVQVTKDPIGHKGARLTSQITLAGRFLVLVPSGSMTGVSRKLPERERARLKSIVSKVAPEEVGVIIRTAAEGAPEEAIIKDFEHLKNQWEHISAQLEELKNSKKPHLLQGEPDVVIRVIRDIFNDDFKKLVVEGEDVYNRIHEYIESAAPDLLDRVERWDPAEHRGKDVFDCWQIDSQLRKGMERQVYLPSGGSLVIDRTEAMTTIDVNTGRFIGKGKSLEETVTRCNLEAAEEVVRQLRLRDIGGMVMIDFVDMVMPANRDLVLRRLVECLSRDRTKHQVAEVTSLGLVQMTRKRVGQGLVEAFSEECPTCGGRGFILHDEPTVSAQYDDPYAMKGGDPFVKTNKHAAHSAHAAHIAHGGVSETAQPREERAGTSEKAKNSMAAIAAASANTNSGHSVAVSSGVSSAEASEVSSGVSGNAVVSNAQSEGGQYNNSAADGAENRSDGRSDDRNERADTSETPGVENREASTTLALISEDLKTLQESRGSRAGKEHNQHNQEVE